MRFSGPEAQQNLANQKEQQADGAAFFITEDVRGEELFPNDGVEQIQEEKSYGSETANEQRKTSNQLMAISADDLKQAGKSPQRSNADLGG